MFKKSYKLNTSLFKEVFNFGKTIKTPLFVIKTKQNTIKHSRFAVVVSKKNIQKAHQRNYFKRKIYHALKEIYTIYPVADYIFILNSEIKGIQYKDLINNLKELHI